MDPTSPETWSQLIDILQATLGNCSQELQHRGPVVLDGIPPGTPPDVPVDADPDQHWAILKIPNEAGTINGTTIEGGWAQYSTGPNFMGDTYVNNLYIDGAIATGKVKVDAEDNLDYLEDQFYGWNDVAEFATGFDLPIDFEKISDSGDDKVRAFVDVSAISGYDASKIQVLFHDDSSPAVTTLPRWMSPNDSYTPTTESTNDARVHFTSAVSPNTVHPRVQVAEIRKSINAMSSFVTGVFEWTATTGVDWQVTTDAGGDIVLSTGTGLGSGQVELETDGINLTGTDPLISCASNITLTSTSGDITINCTSGTLDCNANVMNFPNSIFVANGSWTGSSLSMSFSSGVTINSLGVTGNVNAGSLQVDSVFQATSTAVGFFGVSAATQGAHIADPTGGATVDSEARSAINGILSRLETFGFNATS